MVSDKTLHKAFRIHKTINKTHYRIFLFALFAKTVLCFDLKMYMYTDLFISDTVYDQVEIKFCSVCWP